MITKNYIRERLGNLGYDPDIIKAYDEPHRFWHTLKHVIFILKYLEKENLLNDDVLFLTTVFHDIFYKPYSKNSNELTSILILKQESGKAIFNNNISSKIIYEVEQIILDTIRGIGTTEKSKLFQIADRSIIYSTNINELIDWENKIFKEFQCYDYDKYLEGRLEFLKKYDDRISIQKLITYIKYKQPKIGIYCGSFSPLHLGHLNIIEKAEQIFDKVIIAKGINPEKVNKKKYDLPESIKYRQIEEYEGLLTDFISKLSYDVTLIRGLRNTTDLQFELTQYRYLRDLNPIIKVVSIFCDPEFEHISSSSIRMLEQYGKHEHYLVK
jgi:pantetheine-phosphate adenylyltransferase